MKKTLPYLQLVALLSFHPGTAWSSEPPPPRPREPEGELAEKPPLILSQGEQRVLKVPGLLRFSLGSQNIHVHSLSESIKSQANTKKSGPRDRLLIKGVQVGASDLWVWKEGGSSEHRTIRVEPHGGLSLDTSLARSLQDLQEAEVLLSGKGVILRGSVETLAEATRVEAITSAFPKDVRDETELSEILLDLGQVRLTEWIGRSGYGSRIRLERRAGMLWLEGSLDRPDERTLAISRIRGIFPPARIHIEALPDSAPTVHFRVYLLELKKNRFGALGLGWPGEQEGAFRITKGRIDDLLQLDLTLKALEGDGSVKILSKPELVVRAPGEAELFSGGELPIHDVSRFNSSTTWKPFGLTLKLNVMSTTGEKVRLDIATEVSYLDPTISSDKIPGMQANRMKTQVDARYGSPLLLSGLLQEHTREQAQGLPLLRTIPVLGALFGSEDYLTEKSELVAVLVPSRTPPEAPLSAWSRLPPRGPAPLPRDWISPDAEMKLRESQDFPWNALQ